MSNRSYVNFAELRNILAQNTRIIMRWLPNGQKMGNEWVAFNPNRNDKHLGSFRVNLTTGNWADFATNDRGNDLCQLYHYINGGHDFRESMLQLADHLQVNYMPNNTSNTSPPAKKQKKEYARLPSALFFSPQYKSEPPTSSHFYSDADGVVKIGVFRLDTQEGKFFAVMTVNERNNWEYGGLNRFGNNRPLYNLPAIAASTSILWTEGEKCAEIAATHITNKKIGWVATTSIGGSNAINKTDFSVFKGKKVAIWPDNDAPGMNAANMVAQKALDAGASVVIMLKIPDNWGHAWDIENVLATGTLLQDLRWEKYISTLPTQTTEDGLHDASDAQNIAPQVPTNAGDNKIMLVLNKTQLDFQVDTVTAAIVNGMAQEPQIQWIYQWNGNELVRLAKHTHAQTEGFESGIQLIEPSSLLLIASKYVSFFTATKNDQLTHTLPPKLIADCILQNNEEIFPKITAVALKPIVSKNACIILKEGYDKENRIYNWNTQGIQKNEIVPTEKNIQEAKTLILDHLLVDFPFVSDDTRNAAISYMLLPYCLHYIDGNTPLHLFSATTQGSGKSLLAIGLAKIFNQGVSASPVPDNFSNEEWRKTIFSKLLSGNSHIIFDNVSTKINAPALSLVLTSRLFSDRILGSSRTITTKNNAVWALTANNPNIGTDLSRRVIEIKLDPKCEYPYLRRGLKHCPFDEWVSDNNRALNIACLVLVNNWLQNKQRLDQEIVKHDTLGSFEKWSRVMGAILLANDFTPPVFEDKPRTETLELSVWKIFYSQWWDKFGDRHTPSTDLMPLAKEVGIFEEGGLQFRTENGAVRGLSRKLGEFENRVLGGFYNTRHVVGKRITYQLRMVENDMPLLGRREEDNTNNAAIRNQLRDVYKLYADKPYLEGLEYLTELKIFNSDTLLLGLTEISSQVDESDGLEKLLYLVGKRLFFVY